MLRSRLRLIGVSDCHHMAVVFTGLWPLVGLVTPLYGLTRPHILCFGPELRAYPSSGNHVPKRRLPARVLTGPVAYKRGVIYDRWQIGDVKLYCHRRERTLMEEQLLPLSPQ